MTIVFVGVAAWLRMEATEAVTPAAPAANSARRFSIVVSPLFIVPDIIPAVPARKEKTEPSRRIVRFCYHPKQNSSSEVWAWALAYEPGFSGINFC
jgi:hypothetical protein